MINLQAKIILAPKLSRIFVVILLYILSASKLIAAPVTHPVLGVGHAPIDPGTVEKQLQDRGRSPLASDKELIIPVLTQDVDLTQAKRYKFRLTKIDFTGNTVISSEELRKIYKVYYGKIISLAKILDLINKTTSTYREAGYILSQAYLPAQDIDKDTGELTIGIVEGYINDVDIVSETLPYSTKLLLRQYGERLQAERPITRNTLERYSLLAQDIPGGDIKVVFSPAKNKSGATNIEFVAEHTSIVGAQGFINNRGTRLLGPSEFTGTVHQYNALYGNETSLSATRDDQDDLRFYNFHHNQPLNSDGLALSISGYKTETNPDFRNLRQAIRSLLTTPGDSINLGAQLQYPIIRSREQNLLVHAKMDFTNSKTDFAGAVGGELFKERLRTVKTGLLYDWIDTSFFDILAISLVGIEYTQGLDIFNGYLKAAKATRPNTKLTYNKLNMTVSRSQPLTHNFYLRLFGQGQYAFDELLASEEFGIGGRILGQGYDAYEISGEHGIAGKAELAYDIPTQKLMANIKENLDIEHNSFLNSMINFDPEIFAFIDGGRIWNKNYRDSLQKEHDSIVSSGIGIRGKAFKYFVFEGSVVKPMTRDVINEGDKKPRYFFSVGAALH